MFFSRHNLTAASSYPRPLTRPYLPNVNVRSNAQFNLKFIHLNVCPDLMASFIFVAQLNEEINV